MRFYLKMFNSSNRPNKSSEDKQKGESREASSSGVGGWLKRNKKELIEAGTALGSFGGIYALANKHAKKEAFNHDAIATSPEVGKDLRDKMLKSYLDENPGNFIVKRLIPDGAPTNASMSREWSDYLSKDLVDKFKNESTKLSDLSEIDQLQLMELGVDSEENFDRARKALNSGKKLNTVSYYLEASKDVRGEHQITPDTLGHEIGHSKSKILGNPLVKKYYMYRPILDGANMLGSVGAGIKAGYDEERKGKDKHSFLNKYGTTLLQAGLELPQLAEEFNASRIGLNLMKEHGATDKEIKDARKRLASAFGTYAGVAAARVALQPALRGASKYGTRAVLKGYDYLTKYKSPSYSTKRKDEGKEEID